MWGTSIPVARIPQCSSKGSRCLYLFPKGLKLMSARVMSWLTMYLFSSDNIHGAMAPAHLTFKLRVKTFSRALNSCFVSWRWISILCEAHGPKSAIRYVHTEQNMERCIWLGVGGWGGGAWCARCRIQVVGMTLRFFIFV